MRTGLKVVLKPCKIQVVAMHKNQSVAKDSGEVIDTGRSPVSSDGGRLDDVERDSLPQTGPARAESSSTKVDPTRYGDWERNGRCIDF